MSPMRDIWFFSRVFALWLCLIGASIFSAVAAILSSRWRNNGPILIITRGVVRFITGIHFVVDGDLEQHRPCVTIANHQSSFDIFTSAFWATPLTVATAKKEIGWIPILGQCVFCLYWWHTRLPLLATLIFLVNEYD
jgi:1-acyl-sn-glycerol-3-phosphate acyltransferase